MWLLAALGSAFFAGITSILAKENLAHRTALAVYYLTGKK